MNKEQFPKKKKRKYGDEQEYPYKNNELDSQKIDQNIYEYGNYDDYYRFRNNIDSYYRINLFRDNKDFFEKKQILDIGCNSGELSLQIAKNIEVKKYLGIDIDEYLIQKAHENKERIIAAQLRRLMHVGRDLTNFFPRNVEFKSGNFLEYDFGDVQFNTILCLSITKWIHLNWGDEGIKNFFKKMANLLTKNGILILEPQKFSTYDRKKDLTKTISENFQNIKFKPDEFINYFENELNFKLIFEKKEEEEKVGFKRVIYFLRKV
eukprot:gene5034-8631_t